ncbi:phage tail protein, partial [Streptomyces sp. TRM76130]|nr:phage tail protein [Streptomyces sp. TRM76130]
MSRQDPGSTIWFTLSIDGQSLGYWNGCEGLSSQVEIEQRQEGGNNGFVWQ